MKADQLSPDSTVIVAMDTPVPDGPAPSFRREYFMCRGASLLDGRPEFSRLPPGEAAARLADAGQVHVVLYPTRTYHEGFGGDLFSDISPEDRSLLRLVRDRHPGAACWRVGLGETGVFEELASYFKDGGEKNQYEKEKARPPKHEDAGPRSFIEFHPQFLTAIPQLFRSSMTKPNKQDLWYLATKSFGVNLAVRGAFFAKGVWSGQLPLTRALVSAGWYQFQDAVFTLFGQTYMKFVGKMTGMLRVWRARIGDFAFVYLQFSMFEFLNRLLLGPLGENPLVYTWKGIGLIFLNNLQGMLSGGPMVPAINQMRRVGLIKHNTMMHLYQLSGLTLHFGLFASFGYQKTFTALTTSVFLFSWGGYFICTNFFKDPPMGRIEDPAMLRRLDQFAKACYGT